VLAPFPYSDLSQSKLRPAIVVADSGRGDWLVCQITSNPYGDARAVPLDGRDLIIGGLLSASFARPGKLYTASNRIMVRSVGKLRNGAFLRVVDAIIALFRATNP
jgi:mRNA interferase MazF